MYICPTCGKEYDIEESIRSHFLACWREKNPNHKSKPAPRSDDVIVRRIDNELLNFFDSLGD